MALNVNKALSAKPYSERVVERVGAGPGKRRELVRLEISREAASLFWTQGVSATSGEQIADAVGLSVRTLWRYFRNKESCAEPVVGRGVGWFLAMLKSWPRALSLEEHYGAVLSARAAGVGSDLAAHDLILARTLELAKTEPAIRSVWLMACDEVEAQMVGIVADRLHRPIDDPEMRLHAAAATAVMRLINEDLATSLLADDSTGLDIRRVAERLPRAVRAATGGAIGDPVADAAQV